MAYLAVIVAYSLAQIAVGVWVGRRVTRSGDFFVAGRSLGPGLLAATLLAANIGAGSTVGAAAAGYLDGFAAWWWVGAAALGCGALAVTVGPRIRRVAAEHDLKTVGDFLEWRFDQRVRAAIAVLLWFATLFILAGQLLAIAAVLGTIVGIDKLLACTIGAIVVTTYFAAGGLKSSVAVNVLQVCVKMVGFAVALPLAFAAVGGVNAFEHAFRPGPYWSAWQNGTSGWMYVATLGPAFIVSPGILQKIYGARDDTAVRAGVGLNAVALLLFAPVPPMLGMIARAVHPSLPRPDLALPTLFASDLPFWIGALGLAAIFSAEVSAADALLFMLATSSSQDIYKRFINPDADDARVVRVARLAAVGGGLLALGIAVKVAKSVIDSLAIFYTLLGVSLFVPVVAGLYTRRGGAAAALCAIGGGVAIAGGAMWLGVTNPLGVPAPIWGIGIAGVAYMLASAFVRRT